MMYNQLPYTALRSMFTENHSSLKFNFNSDHTDNLIFTFSFAHTASPDWNTFHSLCHSKLSQVKEALIIFFQFNKTPRR